MPVRNLHETAHRPDVHVALVRGINVGGRNLVPMAELRDLFGSLGCSSIRSLLQSGNVAFTPSTPLSPDQIEAAIRERFGCTVTVAMRRAAEIRAIAEGNPFGTVDPTTLHVGFFSAAPSAAAVRGLSVESCAPELAHLRDAEVYLYLPRGMGRARLPALIERRLHVPITYRNWRTVTRLVDLVEASLV